MPKHTFAAFQHVNGKIIPGYIPGGVEIDMLDVRDAEPYHVEFYGNSVSATLVAMRGQFRQHVCDIPHSQFKALYDDAHKQR